MSEIIESQSSLEWAAQNKPVDLPLPQGCEQPALFPLRYRPGNAVTWYSQRNGESMLRGGVVYEVIPSGAKPSRRVAGRQVSQFERYLIEVPGKKRSRYYAVKAVLVDNQIPDRKGREMTLGLTHESARNATVEWYTPPAIFEALGMGFDLDPCHPEGDRPPWLPAAKVYTKQDDGLAQPWEVWKRATGEVCECKCHRFNAPSAAHGSQPAPSSSCQASDIDEASTPTAGTASGPSPAKNRPDGVPIQSSASESWKRNAATSDLQEVGSGSEKHPKSRTTGGVNDTSDCRGNGLELTGVAALVRSKLGFVVTRIKRL